MHVVPPQVRHENPTPKHVGKKIREYRECKQAKKSDHVDMREEDFPQVQRCDEMCTLLHAG